jgi:carboxymethylenebutenolidase
VVVICGFTGNNEQNKDVVRRFAQAGFYAIAPELYHRGGGMQGKNFQEMGQISGKVTRAQYLGDIRAAADYAKQQTWARADRLGVTGFCSGDALTLHFAAEYPWVAAAVPCYGHLKRTFPDIPGVDAWSLADKIKAPVLGLYGEADPGIPADDVNFHVHDGAALRLELARAGEDLHPTERLDARHSAGDGERLIGHAAAAAHACSPLSP